MPQTAAWKPLSISLNETRFKKKHLVLYHVFITLPDFYWDIEMEPQSRGAVAHVRAWEAEKKNEIEQFMEKAQQMLRDAGFPKEAVTVKIKQSEKGIARDIVEEAKDGYLAVIISRSGEGELPEPFLGTNAAKVIHKLTFCSCFYRREKTAREKHSGCHGPFRRCHARCGFRR